VSSEDYSPVNFSGLGVHDDIRGTAVFGNLSRCLESYPDGVYSFEPGETTFEARCVRPSVPCVSGLLISSSTGSYESKRLRGDVALIAGQNVRLEFDEKDNAIIIHADARYGLNDKCDCEAKDNRRQIMSVNGISAADVEIEGGDCVKVEKREGRIIISDTCSKPCCGCAELTFLNEKTNMITTSIVKLDALSQQLGFKLDEFERNVLLSSMKNATYM